MNSQMKLLASTWHRVVELALSTSAHVCESKEAESGPVSRLQVRVNWISFFNSLLLSKVANGCEHPAGVTWQSICLEE